MLPSGNTVRAVSEQVYTLSRTEFELFSPTSLFLKHSVPPGLGASHADVAFVLNPTHHWTAVKQPASSSDARGRRNQSILWIRLSFLHRGLPA